MSHPRPPCRSSRLRAFAGALALASASCDSTPALQDYQLALHIEGDPGTPLEGAEVTHGALGVGRSDAEGRVFLQVRGSEGQVLVARVSCPEGYRSPPEPLSIPLRRLTESDRQPEYRARCEPLMRTVVVAVRTDRGANLPVMYLGREVARTDAAGAAHFMLKSPPAESIELTLDTSAQPSLRPQNPSVRLMVARHDDVLVFSQAFQTPPPPRAAARRSRRIVNLGAR